MTAGWLNDKERYNWIVNMTPIGRLGEIEEVAGPVVFLASAWASYITGVTLYVDGGWTSR
jgi:2-deoxy-D-gluconate 3-dehydrogenase